MSNHITALSGSTSARLKGLPAKTSIWVWMRDRDEHRKFQSNAIFVAKCMRFFCHTTHVIWITLVGCDHRSRCALAAACRGSLVEVSFESCTQTISSQCSSLQAFASTRTKNSCHHAMAMSLGNLGLLAIASTNGYGSALKECNCLQEL